MNITKKLEKATEIIEKLKEYKKAQDNIYDFEECLEEEGYNNCKLKIVSSGGGVSFKLNKRQTKELLRQRKASCTKNIKHYTKLFGQL